MREIGKTKAANVLVAAGCCAIALIAFQLHGARGEDPRPDLKSAVQPTESTDRIEETERTPPSSIGEESETADGPSTPRVVVLTCRLDQVELNTGLHKN